jgi:hypothetical protein
MYSIRNQQNVCLSLHGVWRWNSAWHPQYGIKCFLFDDDEINRKSRDLYHHEWYRLNMKWTGLVLLSACEGFVCVCYSLLIGYIMMRKVQVNVSRYGLRRWCRPVRVSTTSVCWKSNAEKPHQRTPLQMTIAAVVARCITTRFPVNIRPLSLPRKAKSMNQLVK